MKSFYKTFGLIISFVLIGILSSYQFSDSKKSLSKDEVKSLLFMLEEEKMALDIYKTMDEKWGTMQFNHIKQSEVMHMNFLKNILDENKVKYNLLSQGKFNDQNLQKLYNSLYNQGLKSEIEALKAGAKIEDIDIYDLLRLKKQTENQEIIKIYNFLECGSRNHLRAFTKGLNKNGATYKTEFISQKDYETILNNQQEPCGKDFGMQQGKMNEKGQINQNCGGKSEKNCATQNQEKGQYGKQAECDTQKTTCCEN